MDLSNDQHDKMLKRSNSGTLILEVINSCLIGLKVHSVEENSYPILLSLQCKTSQQYLASGSVASDVMDPEGQPTTFLSQYNS